MESAEAKPLLIFLLAASYFAVFSYAENGNPVIAPVHPPIHPPIHPPDHQGDHGHPVIAPVHPPIHPPIHPPDHHHHHHAPHHPPAHPPEHHQHHHHHHAPRHPPTPQPGHHHPFRRSLVAVEGAVFCQSCKYAGKNDFSGATPIKGAVVKLECKNTAKLTTLTAKTDEQGYFYIQTHNVTSYAYDKCRVFLVSSPLATCDKPTNLLDGLTGAKLSWYQPFYLFKVPYVLYTAGPFAFLPKCG